MTLAWDRVREIVEAALALSADERKAFVARRCDGDEALRDEVLSLLAHDAEEDAYLDARPGAGGVREALAGLDAELPAGARLGPWIVRSAIASGGMGTVYRAERADQSFRKTVAVKLIRGGLDSDELLARFENERRVLAELDHPGIARLLDAGTAEGGRPYFVMEYVRGRAIDVHAREERLGRRARIELFLAVCDAVHAAHQALVVHRDLKPDNVIVTPEGVPKLIDFGIAKVLDRGERLAGDARTLGPSRVMTPAYASPEQIRGERVSTASDVYSLGVLLYELLTGRRPIDFDDVRVGELERAAHERTPEPSGLPRDLDTIVGKALHKAPERRYASAAQLAEDLRRHLGGQPVLARPDTWSYRMTSFVRRNRTLVGALGAVLVSLAAGLGASLAQRDRAIAATALSERRLGDARELASELLFGLDPLLAKVDGSIPAREFAVSTGLRYLDSLAAQASDDPELRREIVLGYLKMGDVQGGPLEPNLGRGEEAGESYRRAFALAERAPAPEPGLLAAALQRLGTLALAAGRQEEALEHYRRALELDPGDSDDFGAQGLIRALAEVQNGLVTHDLAAGDAAGALAHAEQLADLLDELAADAPEPQAGRWRALALTRLGETLGILGRASEAEPKLREAVQLTRDGARAEPGNPYASRALVHSVDGLARFLFARGELEECDELIDESLPLARRMHAADPNDVRAAHDLVAVLNLTSMLNARLDRYAENLDVGAEYREIALALVALDPRNATYRGDLVGARLALVRAYSQSRQHERAAAEGRVARGELEQLVAERSGDPGLRRNLAALGTELGIAHRAWARDLAGEADERLQYELAREAFQRALDLMLALQREGRLAPAERRYIDGVRDDVEACAAALDGLSASGGAGERP